MLETSEDILNIVKALCLIGFTVFAMWGMYYFAMIFKQLYGIIKEMRERVNKIDELIRKAKEKLEHPAAYLAVFGELAKKIISVAKDAADKGVKEVKKRTSKKK